jgi:putative transposase
LNYVSPLCDIFLHSRVECIMPYDPDRHARRSIRMRAYDYAQPGAYFVTVCTQNRECLFGEVMHGEMRLNDPGKMVRSAWDELPRHYPGVNVDGFVVMPNHIHGIVVLKTVGAGLRACPDIWGACPDDGQTRGVAPTMSLPDVVHRFKSLNNHEVPTRLEALSGPIMAKKLLRACYPRRGRITWHPAVHHR